MKKMDLSKTLAAARTHSEQQFASPVPERPSKSDLAARTDTALKARTTPAPKPVARLKAKPIKRVKSIREIFSYSAEDAALLQRLMKRAARTGTLSNKSEVIRAGLFALEKLSDDNFTKTLTAVPRLKPGPPKQTDLED
jgi:hypothetical protein